MSSVHPVGFSLGAQVAGHLGYKLNGKLSRITGLDPAGFLFHNVPPRWFSVTRFDYNGA